MALRTIRTMGDEILKKSCRDVVEMKPRLLQLVDDMLAGLGLRALSGGGQRR